MNSSAHKPWYQRVARFSISIFLLTTLTGCNPHLRVGTISGPETEVMKQVKTVALQDYGLRLKIVEFSDYKLLNAALNSGGIDVNVFQHQPFLEIELKRTHYPLISISKTFIYPMGLYSYQYTHIKEIARRSKVGIPNDPSNETRALRLLEKSGLIKLDIDVGEFATPQAIRYNPKELQFKKMDASQLTTSLQHQRIDLAVINTNYAMLADLYPSEHALWIENKRTRYANHIVIRASDKDNPRLKEFASVCQDEEILAYAKTFFKGYAIPAK